MSTAFHEHSRYDYEGWHVVLRKSVPGSKWRATIQAARGFETHTSLKVFGDEGAARMWAEALIDRQKLN